jgi:hypothetical protein
MDASLAASLVAEVLDDVRDVCVPRGDSSALEALIEHPPRWANERVTLDVLAVARLLANQHQGGPAGALSHHRLGRAGIEIASATGMHRALQIAQGRALRNGGNRAVNHYTDWLPER